MRHVPVTFSTSLGQDISEIGVPLRETITLLSNFVGDSGWTFHGLVPSLEEGKEVIDTFNHLQGEYYFPNQARTQAFNTGLEDLSNIIKLPQICALELATNQSFTNGNIKSLLT